MGASSDVATMSDADKAAAYDAMMAKNGNANAGGPPRWRVVVANKMAGDRVLFSSVSERRARAHIERTCPRGSHHFLLAPDGSMESYEHERLTGLDDNGKDLESAWAPFDRDAYQAPDLSPVNTNDPWADAWEGAQ
jgi:hypothetical protein